MRKVIVNSTQLIALCHVNQLTVMNILLEQSFSIVMKE